MANIKITDLVTLIEPVSTDVLPIVDVSLDVTKKISIAELLRTASLGSQTAPGISFDGDTDTGVYSPGANQLAFTTNGSEALRIDSSGNVGIGTSDPGYELQVSKGNTTTISIEASADDTSARAGRLVYSFSDGDGASINATRATSDTAADVNLSFRTGGITNSEERMRITSAGNVGIGTTSPAGRLNVQGTGAAPSLTYDTANLVNLDQGGIQLAIGVDSASPFGTFLQGRDNNNSARSLLLNPVSGNVGVGTTDPKDRLHVRAGNSGDAAPAIGGVDGAIIETTANRTGGLVFSTPNDRAAGVFFKDPDSTSAQGAVRYQHDDDQMNFLVNGSERVRIDSDGNVGIGTTDPDELLHIEGDVAEFKGTNTNSINVSAATEQVFKFGIEGQKNGVFGPAGSIVFRQDGSTWSSVDANNKPTRIEFCTQDVSTTDESETPRLVVDQNGFVGIGTTAPQAALDINAAASTSPFIASINSSEAARIDNNGRLLVGTSSSINTLVEAGLQVQGTGADAYASFGRWSPNAANPGIVFNKSRGASVGTRAIVENNDNLGEITFTGDDGSAFVYAARIQCQVDGTPGSNDMPGRLVLATTADGASSPTERMRIRSDGDVLFGTTEIPNGISAYGAAFESLPSDRMTLKLATSTTNSSSLVAFYNPNGVVGTIQTNGSATAYNTSSDYRLKENVVPLANAADRLNQLQVHRFNFIADPDTTVDGFLAHEAQDVVPECVTGTKDEVDDEGNPVYQGIDQSKIVPLLTAALQEALVKIESLEQRLTDAGIS